MEFTENQGYDVTGTGIVSRRLPRKEIKDGTTVMNLGSGDVHIFFGGSGRPSIGVGHSKSLEWDKDLKVTDKVSESDTLECGVCLYNEKCIVFNCKHTTCWSCSEKLRGKKCPLCRTIIFSRRHFIL